MRLKRPLLVALAISFVLHLLVISGPAWNLPTLDELLQPDEGTPLEAHLEPHPGPVAVKPVRRKQKPPAPAKKIVSRDGTPDVASAATSGPATDVVPEPVAEEAVVEPVPDLLAVKMILPRFVRIEYRVTMGESGFWIGSAVQELRHDETSYSLRSSAGTVGLVRLFRPADMLNVSEGDIVAGGLRPRRFRIERSNGKNDSATLDWETGVVQLASGRQYPLEPGTQDMLSMFAQLALLGTDGDVVSLPVATGKRVEHYDFTVLGEEKINTPGDERLALHLRNRRPDSKEATDVWLGLGEARLPVKIRHINRQGDIFEQIVERIDYEEPREGKR